MKNLQQIFFILLLPLFCACEQDETSIWKGEDYLPLEVGNYWEYKTTSTSINNTERYTTEATVILNNKTYWPIRSNFPNSPVSYRRKGTDGKIFYKDTDGDEYVKFNLNLNEGEEWQYKQGNNEALWTARLVSKSTSIKLKEYTFENCYHFYYDIPEYADEEHQIILAPGIGIVRFGSSSVGNIDLVTAKVGKQQL